MLRWFQFLAIDGRPWSFDIAVAVQAHEALDDTRQPNLDERVARLRLHAISSMTSPIIYEDLSAVFEALDAPPLPAQKPMPPSGVVAVAPLQSVPSNVRPSLESQLSLNMVPADMLLLALEEPSEI